MFLWTSQDRIEWPMKCGLQTGTSLDQHLWNSLYPIFTLGRASWHSFDNTLFVVNSFNGFGGFPLFLQDPPANDIFDQSIQPPKKEKEEDLWTNTRSPAAKGLPSEAPQVHRRDMGMKVEQVLRMLGGTGEASSALNSFEFQVGSSSTVCMNLKCIAAYLITGLQLRYRRNHFIMTKSMLEDTIEGVYEMLLPERMVVADLGCSSGRNAMLVVSEVLDVVNGMWGGMGPQEPPEVQFFLNDLP
ncbi:hypothetical protein B296_00004388 [Ensete ventricosum]|uniref:Jasmonate O-methyltransferase n=1 Tax=Ensete ventricosum TaxID=4639 RepID=A0A427ATM7_ENSVE|nr:hypothetical protein B296_00004388 [Ensete ventricosum]